MAKLFRGLVLALLLWGTAAHAQSEKFGGVGLQVVPLSTGDIVVLNVLPKSPAAQGGMRPGDLIVEIDGFSLRGSDFAEVVPSRLWGRPGTPVSLKYLRPGEKGAAKTVLRRIPMEPKGDSPPGVRMMTPKPKN